MSLWWVVAAVVLCAFPFWAAMQDMKEMDDLRARLDALEKQKEDKP